MELLTETLVTDKSIIYTHSVIIMFNSKKYMWLIDFEESFIKSYEGERPMTQLVLRKDYKAFSRDTHDLKSSQKRKMQKIVNKYFDEQFTKWSLSKHS